MKESEQFLQKLAEVGLKVNVEKSFFRQTESGYIGIWVSNQGVRPLSSEVVDINKINFPTKLCDVCRFVGLVIY